MAVRIQSELYDRKDALRPLSATATPPGLEAIYSTCREHYPDQPNPLQVTAVVKYWLGGADPLDYISMYANPGDPSRNIPPHWHYITFGLSDLHGDGRVHKVAELDEPSGFGFELTFRLRREDGEINPPTWPAGLLQALARYVFQSENTLCSGDHVSWHCPLDNTESRIHHILMTEDSQLQPISTPCGLLGFLQVVGITSEELKAAQYWNGPGVIELLRSSPVAGGAWLVTDMRRGETVFEIDPLYQERVEVGIDTEGSNLSGVGGRCSWEEGGGLDLYGSNSDGEDDVENVSSRHHQRRELSQSESQQIKDAFKVGFNRSRPLPAIGETRGPLVDTWPERSRSHSFDDGVSDVPTELSGTHILDSVYLKFDIEAGSLLPLALKGRLKHGRHFTFKSVLNNSAITFVSSSVVGSIANEEHPYASLGPWLQLMFSDSFTDRLIEDLEELDSGERMVCPRFYTWPEQKLSIMIVPLEA